ncbi:xylulokinase [Vallitalea longa]|uniref:Xylulokinase n=1 Tax=Vallitalea longa TaxID=2936439 RepID=A0A9W5YCS4_9FIRM|nr:FGGY-family carbohydrate kinase [Vallitalea longa]GKX29993.1 xylulokinase [Vallitalea longa]
MNLKYVIAHDVGTSSCKTVLVDTLGNTICKSSNSYPVDVPHPNWVEQNPTDYYEAAVKGSKNVLNESRISPTDVVGIVFTTQAMGIIPIDKHNRVLRPNITWVDGRAEKQAKKIMKKLMGEKLFKKIVGIELVGKDVIPKLLWIKEYEPTIYNETEYFLDVNGYLKFRTTGKKVTEYSGACSYGFDLKKKDWMRFIIKAAGIDIHKLPPLVSSIDNVGGLTEEAAKAMGLVEGTPVFGGCDDTQSAAIGSSAVEEGEAHIYLGTSAWVCVTTKKNLKFKHAAVCLQSGDPNMNIVVGIIESAGSCIKWIADEFYKHEQNDPNIKNIYELMDEDVKKVPAGSDYLICTPWMRGERCPVSTTTTRATLFNITHEHTREHMMRSVYEGVAYNLRWIIENFIKDFSFNITDLKIIGGGALDKQWMQIISDITKKKIQVTNNPQMCGALGAAMCAFVGLGIYKDFAEIKKIIYPQNTYLPDTNNFQQYDKLFNSYKSIYYSLKKTYSEINSWRF